MGTIIAILSEQENIMFNYYLNKRRIEMSYPIKKYSKWDWIQRRYRSDYYKVKDYYQNRTRAVDNRTMLSRLVDILKVSLGAPVYSYLKHVDANARLISKQFNIVSNIAYGKVHESEIYGDNSYEVFLYTDTVIDIDYIELNWRDIDSLKIIYNENTDLDFHVPFNQNKDFKELTVTIFELDVVTMLLQYYYWGREQERLGNSVNTNVFIATIIYPNTLGSYLDLAVFNRFLNLANGEENKPFDLKQPFKVVDYTVGVDRVLNNIVKDVKNQSIPLTQLLESVPGIVNKNAARSLYMRHKYYTAQSLWVLFLGRLTYNLRLLNIMSKKGIARNKDITTTIPATVKLMERRATNALATLPTDMGIDLNKKIDELKKIVGSR